MCYHLRAIDVMKELFPVIHYKIEAQFTGTSAHICTISIRLHSQDRKLTVEKSISNGQCFFKITIQVYC
jgi:hypothetical protein